MRWSSRTSIGAVRSAAIGCTAAASLCACTTGRGVDVASMRLDDPDAAPAPASTALSAHRPGLRSPIAQICAYPGGKRVLDDDLPGLTTRPEYTFFSAMSLKQLKGLSKGQLKDEDIARVDADLRRLP